MTVYDGTYHGAFATHVDGPTSDDGVTETTAPMATTRGGTS